MAARAESHSIARTSSLIAACTLLSRILGYVRDAVCAAVFGMGIEMSAFNLAWMVPNLFRRFFGEGALASAFIPEAARRRRAGGIEGLRRLLAVVQGGLLAVLLILAGGGVALCLLLPPTALEGFLEPDQARLFLEIAAILFPYMVLICLIALWMGALNTVGHFLAPALAPAVLNLVWIGGALGIALFSVDEIGLGAAILLLAWVVLGGGLVQLVLQMAALRSRGLLVLPRLRRGEGLGRVARDMAPMFLGLVIAQINLLLDQLMAITFVCAEANNYTYYANRLMQFPLGVIGIAVATAAFPTFARHGARGDREALSAEGRRALALVGFLALPAAFGLSFLAPQVVSVLFGHGRVDAHSTAETAAALRFYALGIPIFCAIHLVTRISYATGDTTTPVRIASRLVLVNAALNLALVFPMGVAGLALSTSLTAALNLHLLARALRRRHGVATLRRGSELPWRSLLLAVATCLGAALLEPWLSFLVGPILGLLACICAAAGAYLGASGLLGLAEARRLGEILRRRARSRVAGRP